MRMLRELARSYLTIAKDLTESCCRLKAVYRSWAIPCAGRDVYYTRHRAECWQTRAASSRAERTLPATGHVAVLAQQARRELLAESRKHAITVKLRQIPSLGPIRFRLGGGADPDPASFRTSDSFGLYSGLAFGNRTSAEYGYVKGGLRRSKNRSPFVSDRTTIMI